jgi:hypothetical protein
LVLKTKITIDFVQKRREKLKVAALQMLIRTRGNFIENENISPLPGTTAGGDVACEKNHSSGFSRNCGTDLPGLTILKTREAGILF